jgi:hypothetical protein
MAIIASGARYDPINGLQAVIVITDDNGGKTSDINPHQDQAASTGHIWVPIPAATYTTFTKPQDLLTYVIANLPVIL